MKFNEVSVFYGVLGHAKGLVDAMSGFGINKGPIKKAAL